MPVCGNNFDICVCQSDTILVINEVVIRAKQRLKTGFFDFIPLIYKLF